MYQDMLSAKDEIIVKLTLNLTEAEKSSTPTNDVQGADPQMDVPQSIQAAIYSTKEIHELKVRNRILITYRMNCITHIKSFLKLLIPDIHLRINLTFFSTLSMYKCITKKQLCTLYEPRSGSYKRVQSFLFVYTSIKSRKKM